jgi:hypothetical protein
MILESIKLRVLGVDDMAFVERLYADSRASKISLSGWPAKQIATFLSQQFHVQHTYYQAHYSDAEFQGWGTGCALIEAQLLRADEQGLAVEHSVESAKPARAVARHPNRRREPGWYCSGSWRQPSSLGTESLPHC